MNAIRNRVALILYRLAMRVDPKPRVEIDRREQHEEPDGIYLTNSAFGI